MKRLEVDKEKLSPMMLQYMDIKDKYDDCIIFFRLGDFYEMFFEDAVVCSRILELALTGKQAGLDEKVPMCGIPHVAANSYVDTLVEEGYKVAICEQLEDPKTTKGMVKRDVIQVITKGTRLDNNLDSKDNNFLASIYDFNYSYSISYVDVSTGVIYTSVIERDTNNLIREVTKNNFKEVIVNNDIDRNIVNILRVNYNVLVTIKGEILNDNSYSYIYEDIEDVRMKTSLKHLLYYLVETKKNSLMHLQKAIVIDNSKYLLFDNNTKNNLELIETLKNKERINSLFHLLDKNKTAMGSRFLKFNIENPLTSKSELERRYDFVAKLSTEFILRDELIKSLANVYDLERLTSRISYGNVNAKDLLQLKNSLFYLPTIKNILQELKYDKDIITLEEVYSLLDKAINENAPYTLKEGSLIKKGYNKELDELKGIKEGNKDFILNIEAEEKKKTNIKTLKVGYNKIFGYYIEVSKGQKHLIKDEYGYERKQTLANCERYTTPILKEKENIILNANDKIINLEYKLFMDVREFVKRYTKDIQEVAKVISEVDCLQSFSIVSDNYSYVRPTLTNDQVVKIIDSRHPVVERVLNDNYVKNNIIMDKNTNILLITGPNMAGKSTYMRQFAITVIMAQIGCFVPATSCKIPIFDKIFTRIGASDDLVGGDSTFMVEMKEANYALKEATKNSLILFDELGRGTATYDGMSLAQAILEYIHDKIEAKTLFSTHYHELTTLEKTLSKLKNVHVQALEEGNKLVFLHKVEKGAVDKSYGIHVASLAHLPDSLIERSKEILNIYENKPKESKVYTQTTLFDELDLTNSNDEVINKIKELDILKTTPLDALNFLYSLKENIDKENPL